MNSTVLANPASPASTSWAERNVTSVLRTLLPLLGVLGLVLLASAPTVFVPAEDATILFQYSDNWAATKQITYYSGGPRVEGATDFLWMAVLAAGRLIHVPPFWATAGINVLSVFAIAYLLFLFAHRRPRARDLLIPTGLILLMPQFGAALAGFSVLPFSALILAAAYLFYRQRDLPLGITCLALCLFRPDGVIFALPLILFRLFRDKRQVLQRFSIYLFTFVMPGLLYFYWRWHYFGELLPLPFLVKSDTPRFLGIALATSNINLIKYLVLDGVLLPWVLGARLLQRQNLQLLLAIGVIPTFFYAAMRLDQNIADRFFCYLVVCAALLVALNWDKLQVTKARAMTIFAVLWLVCLSAQWVGGVSQFFSDGYRNNVVAIACELKSVHPAGKLALSEAGRIAYFSGWPTIDLWGLNTPEYAHHLISPQDIERESPDLLVLYYPQTHHDCRYVPGWDTPHTSRTWPDMAQNVITGLHDANSYDLLMVPSSGVLRRALYGNRPGTGEYQCWFVKRTYAGHDQVTRILLEHAALSPTELFKDRAMLNAPNQGAGQSARP